jgi:8-amino-3,8-dideoxy-alpha-D-manno-octulosonate transaminase
MMDRPITSARQPAAHGGEPAIAHPLPPMYPGGMRLAAEEEAAVLEVIRSKRLFRYYGPQEGESKVAELEKAFAGFMGSRYALAVTSGTAALICGLVGLGIGPGDEVIVPAYTWIASASAVLATGAVPVIAEVDASLTLDPADVAAKITPYTRAILAVHMRGASCDMRALVEMAHRHNLSLLEDTAQANGAGYRGRRLGTFGDAGAFSLQFNKIITSGEGGMLITDREDLWLKAVMYHDVVGGQRNHIPFEQIAPGINFRMPELLGAVGLAQLRRLDEILADARRNKAFVKENIAPAAAARGITFRTQNDPAGEAGIAMIFFANEAAQAERIAAALNAEGAPAFVLYSPGVIDYHIYPHWAPIMNRRGFTPKANPWQNHPRTVEYTPTMCPRSLDLLSRAVHLDISPDLSATQLEELTEAIHKVFVHVA